MRAYIIYNKRSCVTGKALFDLLSKNRIGGYKWRRSNIEPPKQAPSLIIRWGNSLHDVPNSTIELNTQQAVRGTTDKLNMIKVLSATEGVRVPQVAYNAATAGSLSTIDNNVFIRNQHDHVRFDSPSSFRATDKYALAAINKQREFRVHVFDGKTIGIYEKIPHNESIRIYKDATCDFRRIDQSSDEDMRGLKGNENRIGIRPMAIAAVRSLGLLFGGVDVLMDTDGTFYVNEVNSAPSLNTPNLDRWCEAIESFITTSSEGGAPSETSDISNNRRADREEIPRGGLVENSSPRPVVTAEQLRAEARANLVDRVRELVQSEGYVLHSIQLV